MAEKLLRAGRALDRKLPADAVLVHGMLLLRLGKTKDGLSLLQKAGGIESTAAKAQQLAAAYAAGPPAMH